MIVTSWIAAVIAELYADNTATHSRPNRYRYRYSCIGLIEIYIVNKPIAIIGINDRPVYYLRQDVLRSVVFVCSLVSSFVR